MTKNNNPSQTWLAALSFIISFGTLFCCALPALLITLGMGAVVAGLISTMPQLVWFSEHKIAVFSIAGFFLVLAGVLRNRGIAKTCPVDPVKAKICGGLKNFSAVVYWLSIALYAIGFFFAFLVKYFL
jgi:hypothetical protein